MQLEVALAGITSFWRFPGSSSFQTWLERLPWLNDGGLCVLRPGPGLEQPLLAGIKKAAYALHSDEGYFAVRKVLCGSTAGTPRQALLQHFGLDRKASLPEARDAIRLTLQDRPRLLVLTEQDQVSADDWEMFVEFVEHLRKSSTTIPLAVVVLDSKAKLTCEPLFHFPAGYASLQVTAGAAAMDESTVWPRYLHLRAWWDAGGSLLHASALAQRLETVKQGDDDSVEAMLQTYAVEMLKQHPCEQMLEGWLDLPARDNAAKLNGSRSAWESDLTASSLLWRPPGLLAMNVAPFAARALLAEFKLSEAKRAQLRHALVCAPLASELLGLCLMLETKIRFRLLEREQQPVWSADPITRYKDFVNGMDQCTHYPQGHPASPTRIKDVWVFATMGECLNSYPRSAVSDLDHQLRKLRNCLAHGHYVAWSHCRTALQGLRLLDR